jgi:hypothetical protein
MSHLQDGKALPERRVHGGPRAHLQNDVIELLKSLRVLPLNSRSLVVDEVGGWTSAGNPSGEERRRRGLERRRGRFFALNTVRAEAEVFKESGANCDGLARVGAHPWLSANR